MESFSNGVGTIDAEGYLAKGVLNVKTHASHKIGGLFNPLNVCENCLNFFWFTIGLNSLVIIHK